MEQNRLDSLAESFKKHLDSLSEQELLEIKEKYFTDDRPKGWLNIEEHLPMMFAEDLLQGYSVFKVRDAQGNEFETHVTDHHVWYYSAKEAGITHWLNE